MASAVSTGFWVALWAAARSRGLDVEENALRPALAYGMRGALFTVAAAVGAYALTELTRSVAATVAIVLGLGAAASVLPAVLGLSDRWTPIPNLDAIVAGSSVYDTGYDPDCVVPASVSPRSACPASGDLTAGQGVGYFGLPLLLVGTASAVAFARRRDS